MSTLSTWHRRPINKRERNRPLSATFKLKCLHSVILQAKMKRNHWFNFNLSQFSYIKSLRKQSSKWYLHQTKNTKTKTISISSSSQDRWLRVRAVQTSSPRLSSIGIQETSSRLPLPQWPPPIPQFYKTKTTSQYLIMHTIWVPIRHN